MTKQLKTAINEKKYFPLIKEVADFVSVSGCNTKLIKMIIFFTHSYFYEKLSNGKTRHEIVQETQEERLEKRALEFIKKFEEFDNSF